MIENSAVVIFMLKDTLDPLYNSGSMELQELNSFGLVYERLTTRPRCMMTKTMLMKKKVGFVKAGFPHGEDDTDREGIQSC
jgi:hypothetical protein